MKLSRSCYAATGLAYSPPWSVNAGIVAGSNLTLVIDTGSNSLSAATIHGYAQAVRSGNSLRVINAEKHFDHIGGNSYFRSHGVEIWGHVGIKRSPEEFQSEVQDFNDAIANPIRRARNEAAVFYSGTGLANPDHAISADTSFDLGDCPVAVILSPGHTPTNVSVWIADDRVLICGDCLLNGYLPNLDAGTPADWKIWLKSLDRIEALKPLTILPGHGPVATNDDVPRLIDAHRKIISAAIERGYSPTDVGQTSAGRGL